MSGLKSFKIFSRALDTVIPAPDEPDISPLIEMLVNNCPELEVRDLLSSCYPFIAPSNSILLF